jgi:hypothetical protein
MLDYWTVNISKMFGVKKSAAKRTRLDAEKSNRRFTWWLVFESGGAGADR